MHIMWLTIACLLGSAPAHIRIEVPVYVAKVEDGVTSGIAALVASGDGKRLAWALSQGTVRLWDISANKASDSLSPKARHAAALAFSPDGKTLVSNGEDLGELQFWDVATQKGVGKLRCHRSGFIWSAAFSPDGKFLASGAQDTTVALSDVSLRQRLATLGSHEWTVTSVLFSPDGKTVISGAESDGTVRLWDVAGRKEVARYGPFGGWKYHFLKETSDIDNVTAVAISPNGKTVAVGYADGKFRLVDLPEMKERKTLLADTTDGLDAHSLAFSPSGALLAASGNQAVHLWDVVNAVEIAHIEKADVRFRTTTFAPNGTMYILGHQRDGTIALWKVGPRILNNMNKKGGQSTTGATSQIE